MKKGVRCYDESSHCAKESDEVKVISDGVTMAVKKVLPTFVYLTCMNKDNRYDIIKTMIEVGRITEFSQLFNYIPKSVIAADLNSSHRRLTRLTEQLDKLEMGELYAISKLVGVKMEEIYKLTERQLLARKAETGKKRKNQSVNG